MKRKKQQYLITLMIEVEPDDCLYYCNKEKTGNLLLTGAQKAIEKETHRAVWEVDWEEIVE